MTELLVRGLDGEGPGDVVVGRLVKFLKDGGDELPDHELGVGDLVMVSKRVSHARERGRVVQPARSSVDVPAR